jgi:FAD/FMN-containing dehydrogenase
MIRCIRLTLLCLIGGSLFVGLWLVWFVLLPWHLQRPSSTWDTVDLDATMIYGEETQDGLDPKLAEATVKSAMAADVRSDIRSTRQHYTFCNFDRSSCCRGLLHYPTTEEQVAKIVAAANTKGEKVRVFGAGHSMSSIVCESPLKSAESFHLISLDRMSKLLDISERKADGALVTVQAGIRLRNLNEVLASCGLAMRNLGLIDEQSIVGAISTGTHGTGIQLQSLPNIVKGLHLVLANGTILVLNSTTLPLYFASHPHLFGFSKLSLGLLGVITQVTLHVTVEYKLWRQHLIRPMPAIWDSFEKNSLKYRNYQFWRIPGSPWGLENYIEPFKEETEGESPSVGSAGQSGKHSKELSDLQLLLEGVKTDALYSTMVTVARWFPSLTGYMLKLLPYIEPETEFIGRSDKILNFPGINYHSVRYSEIEIFVPFAVARLAVDAIVAVGDADPDCVETGVALARTIKSDGLPLSPMRSRTDSVYVALSYVLVNQPAFLRCARRVQDALLPLGGRPHWGKRHFLTAADVRRLYGADVLDAFQALIVELDPKGTFQTQALKVLFDL